MIKNTGIYGQPLMRKCHDIQAILALLFVIWPLVVLAEDPDRIRPAAPAEFPSSRTAIEFNLHALQKLGDSIDLEDDVYAKSLGFLSVVEAGSAKPGSQVQVFRVPYTQLKHFLPE